MNGPILRRAVLTWLLLLVAMVAAGAFRVAVVAPWLSPFGTEIAGALLGIAVILALTLWLGLTVSRSTTWRGGTSGPSSWPRWPSPRAPGRGAARRPESWWSSVEKL